MTLVNFFMHEDPQNWMQNLGTIMFLEDQVSTCEMAKKAFRGHHLPTKYPNLRKKQPVFRRKHDPQNVYYFLSSGLNHALNAGQLEVVRGLFRLLCSFEFGVSKIPEVLDRMISVACAAYVMKLAKRRPFILEISKSKGLYIDLFRVREVDQTIDEYEKCVRYLLTSRRPLSARDYEDTCFAVGHLVAKDASKIYHLKRNGCARRIQRRWRECICNPEYLLCRHRLLREYDEMAG